MKTLKKFETFEELKSADKKNTDHSLSVKRHNELEAFVKLVKATSSRKIQSK